MCGFLDVYNHSFRWITYLLLTTGIYTFLHWLLAVPLFYSHFYECCNEKWSKDWVVWLLVGSFATWLVVCIAIVVSWWCLKRFKERHLNESNVHLTAKSDLITDLTRTPEGKINEKTVVFSPEKNDVHKSPKKVTERRDSSEMVALPALDPRGSFTIVQMNDLQENKEPISGSDFPIPVEESRHYVQSSPPRTPDKDKPPKTPREIFFQDMIEAASNAESYFDFDPQKISDRIFKISSIEEDVETDTSQNEDDDNQYSPRSKSVNLNESER